MKRIAADNGLLVGFANRHDLISAFSNTQLFNDTLEDLLFLVQRLPPLVFFSLYNLLSQIGHIDFQRAARGISLWLAEVE
jgi:hypothetical protein